MSALQPVFAADRARVLKGTLEHADTTPKAQSQERAS